MSATALTAKSAQTCPAWCQHEADGDKLHQSEVHEVGEVMLSLHQYFGEKLPMIGICDWSDQELSLSLDEAERAGTILLQLVRAARKATAPRAA